MCVLFWTIYLEFLQCHLCCQMGYTQRTASHNIALHNQAQLWRKGKKVNGSVCCMLSDHVVPTVGVN